MKFKKKRKRFLVLRTMFGRKPDNVVWAWPWTCFCVGWGIQKYHFNAVAITICLGVLMLRWHDR